MADSENASSELQRKEQGVEAHSAVFKKELGLTDLVLTQVLFIVGLPWVGVAAKQGPSHIIFWLIAMFLFYVPSAVVVIYLNRIMPLEGGLYQWAKMGFNELLGFLVAWNLWLFAILNTSEIGLQVTQYLRYMIVCRDSRGRMPQSGALDQPLCYIGRADHRCHVHAGNQFRSRSCSEGPD